MRRGIMLGGIVCAMVAASTWADTDDTSWHTINSGNGGSGAWRLSPGDDVATTDDTAWHTTQDGNGGSGEYREAPPGEAVEAPGWYAIITRGREATPVVAEDDSVAEESTPVESAPAIHSSECMDTRALLAQRLLELRGIALDPNAALLVLPTLDAPMSPMLARDLFGREVRLSGGTFLTNVLSWDLRTRGLVADLAQCEIDRG